MSPPRITVVTATYNRSRHILATLRSVLGQSMGAFEYLVIGDACDDDTGAVVDSVGDARVRWVSLAQRSFSQSGPNAAGLKMARAPIVAYLGHDDIWAPDHLEAVLGVYAAQPDLGAVVSGLLMHGPVAARPVRAFGLFERVTRYDATSFVPPSALSHRVALASAPQWRARSGLDLPVDMDFQRQLLQDGVVMGSTGRVTVHKWPSGPRYLSYLSADSRAQSEMLEGFRHVQMAPRIAGWLETARRTDQFMIGTTPPDMAAHLRRVDDTRGVDVGAPRALGQEGARLSQDAGARGTDWRPPGAGLPGYRWCGPSHAPRFLVPFHHDGAARIELDVIWRAGRDFPLLGCFLNGRPVDPLLDQVRNGAKMCSGRLCITGPLRVQAHSVLQFELAADTFVPLEGSAQNGFALGEMRVQPCAPGRGSLPSGAQAY